MNYLDTVKHLLSLVFFLITTCSLAQVKYEKEYRISTEDVPESALQFVDALEMEGKVKWYQEEGYGRSSIEAKATSKQWKYSIEFDTEGNLEDVEIVIKKKELPSSVFQSIDAYLNSNYKKYRFCKIQRQYTGDPQRLLAYLRDEQGADGVTIRYEIVARVKNEVGKQEVEFLFDARGAYVSSAVIIQKNIDNLEY